MHARTRPLFWLTSSALTAALAASGRPALADDTADPVDPIEEKALRSEAKAKFGEALDEFRKAFDACVTAAKAGGAAREKNLARAEVMLEKIESLTERITRHGESEKFLSGYDAESLGPVLESQVRFERARDRLAAGDLPGAANLLAPLGIARHFWIVGPFDNERGRGFKTEFGPEKKIDLDAVYDGKERKVAWREIDVNQALGYLDFDALLRPNDQAAAYALAFVNAPAAADGAIRLGSDEAVRAWWNGKEILTRDVRRRMGFDQDVVGVKLNAGWNALLVKVHDQTGEWGTRVRVTAADGSSIAGLTFATSRAEADLALKALTPAEAFTGAVAGGAKQYYDGVTGKAGSAGPRDFFHLGYLHARRDFDAQADRRAENLLKQAADAEPGNAIYRFHYAEAAAPPAELAVEKEENRQRAGREKAIETDPDYAVAYRALASYYTSSLINLERAEQLLRRALEVNPEFWQARLDLAAVLERRGLKPAAGQEREKALAAAAASGVEEAARAAAAEADRNAMGPAAATAWREVLKLDARSDDARRRVAELAAQALDPRSALGVLDEIALWNPYDVSARARKAELLEGADDLAGAEAALRQALAVAPEDDHLLQALGRVQAKQGKDKDALATLRDALRVNPKLQNVERYVEFLDPEAAPFEDEFRVDIAPLVAKAKDWKNPENDGWMVLLDQTVTKVNRDGTTSNYVHMSAKILGDAGKQNFDTYRAGGWGESFKWKVARVVKPDGKVVEAKTFSQRGPRADFPPLETGDVIDVEYRRDDREQSVFGDYFGESMFFADQVPVLKSTWSLITPAERTFYFNQKNFDAKPDVAMRDDGKTRVYTWTREDIAKIRQETGMPDMREVAPQVQVTTYRDWNEFAQWWSALIKDQLQASDEMKAKVRELTEGKESRMDKIRAIYDFVTGDITYQAWPFGPHGYKPYTAQAIFEKKEGDCKDKAILFNTLIKEIGVDGYPVLIYADQDRSEEDLSLAMVGHFNHCIAYVPDADGKGTPMFFDGTAEYASAFLPPMMDQGARVLVVKPEGAEVMTIPKGAPETMGIAQTWNVNVREDGGADITCRMSWRGDLAVQMRRMFSVEGQRNLILQGLFTRGASLGKLKIVEATFDDLKDLSRPEANFTVKLDVEKFVQGKDDARTLPARFLDVFGGQLQQIVARPTREHDLIMSNALGFRTEAEYVLPAGWTVTAAPESAKLELPSATFEVSTTHEGTKLTLVRDLRLLGQRVKASDYPAFREAVSKAAGLSQQQWKVKKGETAAAPAAPKEETPK